MELLTTCYFHEYTNLECRIKIFGVMKGLIEDSSQSLVKISALLHETLIMAHKILGIRRN